MCQIFGAILINEMSINKLLKKFYSHSIIHHHGWGLAVFPNFENNPKLIKEPKCAIFSKTLKQNLSTEINKGLVLAHIRYASIGNKRLENCHPFIKVDKFNRTWTLIHNGTIYSGARLKPYKATQIGKTDSERILCYIIDKINNLKNPPSSFERFKIMEEIIFELSYRNLLNLIFFDGELLYIHTNYRRSLYQKSINGNMLFCTAPLDNNWEKFPINTLVSYKDGNLQYIGKQHKHQYPISWIIGY